MNIYRVNKFVGVVVFLFLFFVLIIGRAEAGYPEKPITIIVPWAAGGISDIMSRTVAKPISEELKQPVIVINKAGAAGVTGTLEAERATPDGYTIASFSISQVLTQYTSPNPTSIANIVCISHTVTSPATITVNANAPWNTLKEFIEYAKANPGKIRSGNSGKGASAHIFGEAFDKAAGVKQTHVPFTGYAPAVTALAGGHIEATSIPVGDVFPMVKAGKLKILAVAADEKHYLLPNVPTMKELGVNVVIDNWQSLVAPKGTPVEIIEIIDKATEKALKRPDVIKVFNDIGYVVTYKNRKTYTEWLNAHDAYLRGLIDSLGLRVAPKK